MSTTEKITPKPNSFKTVVTDKATGKTLAEWFSLNERPDKERRAVSRDLYAVLRMAK